VVTGGPEEGCVSGSTPRAGFPLRVVVYASSVIVLGFTLLTVVLVEELPRVHWMSRGLSGSLVLMVLLFAGELRRFHVMRSDGDTDRLTVSSTFAVALVMTGPLSLAILAQLLATGLDDLRRGRPLLRVAFNLAQYVVTLTAVRAMFTLPQGQSLLAPFPRFNADDVLPAVLAAVTYFVVNIVVVDVVVALDSGQQFVAIVREDLRAQGMSSLILLGLAPVTAVTTSHSLVLVPLIALPLLGVQRSAWIATQRHHEALHDSLTGLPNRALFHVRAEQTMTTDGGRTAVMLVDLDHFKEVNDTLGHQAGDCLLREVAVRMTAILDPSITVARLGGDEFAVIVPPSQAEQTAELAEQMMAQLREPVVVDGVRIGIHASAGVAFHPDHAATVEALLQRADIALYRAKANRGEVQVYSPDMNEHTVERLNLVSDLQSAMESDEFGLVYQPQIALLGARPVSVEALTRWQHPVNGAVPPDVFIPLAENNEMIATMTHRAVESALAAVHILRADGHDVAGAVNLSARLLSDLGLPCWLEDCLRAEGVPGTRLTVEVTETSITADPVRAMKVLNEVRELGVRIAIDDFGTGYSSLSYLRRLQPDEIKIDKSFVVHMLSDENSAVIVRSTIDLAHGLGLEVVAEGVEDQATYTALASLGCDRVQGYFVAHPMPIDDLRRWMSQPVPKPPSRAPAVPGRPAHAPVLALHSSGHSGSV
jgi:diguanylate cyclase (GGDEF)-like protein